MRPAPAPLEPARRWRFLPPLLWMALIALGSSSALGADHTEGWASAALGHLLPHASPALIYDLHAALRKMGHVVEYGILAVLWRRALAPAPRALVGALALAAAYAGVDEWRQGLAPNRDASVLDALLDSVAAAAALASWEGSGRVAAITFRALAWAATLGAALAAAGPRWTWRSDRSPRRSGSPRAASWSRRRRSAAPPGWPTAGRGPPRPGRSEPDGPPGTGGRERGRAGQTAGRGAAGPRGGERRGSAGPIEPDDHLDVRRVGEHVDRLDRLHAVARGAEDPQVPRQRGGIAGDVHHPCRAQPGQGA